MTVMEEVIEDTTDTPFEKSVTTACTVPHVFVKAC